MQENELQDFHFPANQNPALLQEIVLQDFEFPATQNPAKHHIKQLTMKKVLKQIGITLRELADLLLVSEKTLDSWFTRKKSIPVPYNLYLSTLDHYHQHHQESISFSTLADSISRKLYDEDYKAVQKRIKRLNVMKESIKLQQQQLNEKWHKQLMRIHFATHYESFLPKQLQHPEPELFQDMLQVIERKSRFEERKWWLKSQKLKQRLVVIEAELAFLNDHFPKS